MSINSISKTLSGGDPRSLGNAEQVVTGLLENPERFDELFSCLYLDDETIRMRASDALEKIARERADLFAGYHANLLHEIAAIDQPSVQWHLAQIFTHIPLTATERSKAVKIMQRNLTQTTDWIVITTTLSALAEFAQTDQSLRKWLLPYLKKFKSSDRKAIAKRAEKLLRIL